MTALALWVSLLFVSAQAQAPARGPTSPPVQSVAQTVSLVDLLVEAQTLYTLAVDKQPESLTAALDLARQAQKAVADDTVRKRLPAGVRPDAQDLTVLGALRARISTLVNSIEKRRDAFKRQSEDIQNLLQRKRLADAGTALDRLPADAPTADPACPFTSLREELARTVATADDYRAQARATASMGLPDDAIKLYRRAQAVDPWGADYDALGQEARDHAALLGTRRREIRSLLDSRRVSSAAREMAEIAPLLPVDDGYQFDALKAELLKRQQDLSDTLNGAQAAMTAGNYATAERLWREAAVIDKDQLFDDQIHRAQESGKLSAPKPSHRFLTQGIVWTAVLAGTGIAAHMSMNEKQDQMSYFWPGSYEWWSLYDDAEQMRKTRNGLYAAAFGVGAAVTIYGAIKSARANTAPSHPFAPFGPKTFVGFNIDPKRPAIMVVKIF